MTTTTKTKQKSELKINKALLTRSSAVAAKVMKKASAIRNVKSGKDVDYAPRRNGFVDLVGKRGFMSFTPLFEVDYSAHFNDISSERYRQLRREYNGCLLSQDRIYEPPQSILSSLREHITNEHLFSNTIPNETISLIGHFGAAYGRDSVKDYQSPKLSKLLSKLFTEQSTVMNWYTNQCPKNTGKEGNISVTEISDAYDVIVSVLPHHIAGMSYYSSYNNGGLQWDTQGGTSCQDPYRHGTSHLICGLPASVRDETLAVAYLTKKENNDIMNPVYEARQLIRIVELKDGKVFFVGLKTYGSKTTKAILNSGLENQFTDIYFSMKQIDKMNEKMEIEFDRQNKYYDPYSKNEIVTMKLSKPALYFRYDDCMYCSATGKRTVYTSVGTAKKRETCACCEGTGLDLDNPIPHTPYNDNPSLWKVNTKGDTIKYALNPHILDKIYAK